MGPMQYILRSFSLKFTYHANSFFNMKRPREPEPEEDNRDFSVPKQVRKNPISSSIERLKEINQDVDYWKNTVFAEIQKAIQNEVNLASHHTNSYNCLVRDWIPSIVSNYGKISTEYEGTKYKFVPINYTFVRKQIKPSDAHMFNTSYVGTIYVDYREIQWCSKKPKGDKVPKSNDRDFPWVIRDTVHKNVPISDLPLMLNSEACYLSDGYDSVNQTEPELGGGFIVKGNRRFIPMMKTLVNNYPYRFHKKGIYYIHFRSEHLNKKNRSTSTLEIFLDENKTVRTSTYYNIYIKIPFLATPVSLSVILLALGWSLEDFIKVVKDCFADNWNENLYGKYLLVILNDHMGCCDRDSAIGYINKLYGKAEHVNTARNVVKNEILPHINTFTNANIEQAKGFMLGYLASVLIQFRHGKMKESDRDSYQLSVCTDSATNLATLFKNAIY